jgi:hypothetical protein
MEHNSTINLCDGFSILQTSVQPCVITQEKHILNSIFQSNLLNPLKTKHRLLYLKTQSVPRSKNGYKNQLVYAVSGTSRCLFSDKYKTHKYSVDRAYSC